MKHKNYTQRLLIGGILALALSLAASAQQTLSSSAGFYTFPGAINLHGDVAGTLSDPVSQSGYGYYYFNTGLSASVSPLGAFCQPGACGDVSQIVATGINDNGLIIGAGYKQPAWNVTKGWVCAAPCNSGFTVVDVLNATRVFPTSINNNGVIVGSWDDLNNISHAFIRDERGRVTKFDAPNVSRSAPTFTTPSIYVNANGEMAGHFVDTTNKAHVFYRTAKGQVSTIDIPNSLNLSVTGINNAGVIIGTYAGADGRERGFILTGVGRKSTPVVTTCDNANSAYAQVLVAINNNGIAVGRYVDAGNFYHSFRCNANGVISSLDYGPAGTNTIVSALNDNNVYTFAYAAGPLETTTTQTFVRPLP